MRDSPQLLTAVLRDVSRAFYLTLRVLPAGIREPVGIAYLLARAADTIADTQALPVGERLAGLLALRAVVVKGGGLDATLEGILGRARTARVSRGEQVLLSSLPPILEACAALQPRDRGAVRSIVATLTQGMEDDLRGFPPEDSGAVGALDTAEELDRYTWYVAGCVGEFWTRITIAHTPVLRQWDVEAMCDVGVRFGKALQLVNVLRDMPRDLRNGRCYLPAEELRDVGLAPADLLDPTRQRAAQPVIDRWIARALDCFASAEAYVLAIPRRCTRLRLAALWPVLIGLATLRKLAASRSVLDPRVKIKVSRGWIYRMILLSIPASLSDGALRWWFRRLREPDGPRSN